MAVRAVYTKRFLAGYYTAASSHHLFVVPSGKVAIVTDVQAVTDSGTFTAGWYVWPLQAGPRLYVGITPVMSVNVSYQWHGKVVANPGDAVGFIALTGNPYAHVTGYLLTDGP